MRLTKISFVFLLFFLLLSCEDSSKNEIKKVSISSSAPIIQNDVEVKVIKDKTEMSVGGVVTKAGDNNGLPGYLKIYKDAKIYTNSNVENYVFFVMYDGSESEKIGKYYYDEYKKMGYDVVAGKLEDESIDYNNLEIKLKNKNYVSPDKVPEYFAQNEINPNLNIEDEYINDIKVYIKDTTPENIKKGLGLEGVFVEIYY